MQTVFCRRGTKILSFFLILTVVGNLYLCFTDPTFDLPFPAQLPFVSKESRFYFGLNFWTQMFGYFICYGFIVIDFLIFVTITRHIITEMEVINNMCLDIGTHEKDYLETLEEEDDDGLETIRLADEAKEAKTAKADILLKLILDRHNKVIKVIQNAANLYVVTILCYEGLSFSNLLFIYYLLAIFGGFYHLIFGTIPLLPQYYIVSWIGSSILEMGKEMTKTLYDSHWLHLKPKDRKVLCIILAMAQKPHGLSVGGFADVALARFAVVMTFTYRCCLLLSFFQGKSQGQRQLII